MDNDRPRVAAIALWYLFLSRGNLPTPPANELAPALRIDGYLLADPEDDVARAFGVSVLTLVYLLASWFNFSLAR